MTAELIPLAPGLSVAGRLDRADIEALARAGAAVVVEESKLEGVWLAETIAALLQDSHRLQRMSQAARELAHPNAARDIAAMAARVAGIEDRATD